MDPSLFGPRTPGKAHSDFDGLANLLSRSMFFLSRELTFFEAFSVWVLIHKLMFSLSSTRCSMEFEYNMFGHTNILSNICLPLCLLSSGVLSLIQLSIAYLLAACRIGNLVPSVNSMLRSCTYTMRSSPSMT